MTNLNSADGRPVIAPVDPTDLCVRAGNAPLEPPFPASTLGELLTARAQAYPTRPLLEFEGQVFTYGEVDAQTNRLANVLAGEGIRRGDRVAVILDNGCEYPLTWLALAKLGAIMVPVSTSYRARDLLHVLQDCDPALTISRPECARELQVLTTSLGPATFPKTLSWDTGSERDCLAQRIASASCASVPGVVQAADVLNIQYTSGTTGLPKGCMLTHEYWLTTASLISDALHCESSDRVLAAQPFCYMDPQWLMTLCIVAGCTLVLLPRFSASSFWRTVKDRRITVAYLVGAMPTYLYKQPEDQHVEQTHRLRLVLCSGIPRQLHRAFEARWRVPWRETYGSTESGIDLIVDLSDDHASGTGAVGRPVRTKEVKVVNATGAQLVDGMIGELVVRGTPMMRGYFRNEAATATKVRDEWLFTGDLGFKGQDGHFYLVGRTKDMIRRSGENISAVEVEMVLCEHPAVQLAAVVPVPDAERGEEVKAFVQVQEGTSLDPAELVRFVRERLAAFKAPRFIEFIREIPRTTSQKIAKHLLQEARPNQRTGAFDAVLGKWG